VKVAIRVDASRTIGSGHVMRCLALADALRARGATIHFICRGHEGDLIAFIRDKQYICTALSAPGHYKENMMSELKRAKKSSHTSWLGVSWYRDAQETRDVLRHGSWDWLIVDHYALDRRWELMMRSSTKRIMVIDDLADREHDCDILLDSLHGRQLEDYHFLTPNGCRFLLGSRFVMLRSEFVEWRPRALKRRKKINVVQRFLVTLGGADPDNLTGAVLEQLAGIGLPKNSEIEVILGSGFLYAREIREQTKDMPVHTHVSIAVDNMAEKMANVDFAVGAGGVSIWERCCLGLPAVTIVTAENQSAAANVLEKAGANKIILARYVTSFFRAVFLRAVHDYEWYVQAVSHSSQLIDGKGAVRVATIMTAESDVSL